MPKIPERPYCCKCGTIDPVPGITLDENDKNVKFYWTQLNDDDFIEHMCLNNNGEVEYGCIVILEKNFSWSGRFDLLCAECTDEVFEALAEDDQYEEYEYDSVYGDDFDDFEEDEWEDEDIF